MMTIGINYHYKVKEFRQKLLSNSDVLKVKEA